MALDKACLDLIKNTSENGTEDWVNQLKDLKGENTIAVAEYHGIGTQKYKLILLEEDDKYHSEKIDLVIIIVFIIIGVAVLVTLLVVFIIKNKNSSTLLEDFHLTQRLNE